MKIFVKNSHSSPVQSSPVHSAADYKEFRKAFTVCHCEELFIMEFSISIWNMVSYDLLLFMLQIITSIQESNSMPFLVHRRNPFAVYIGDHLRFGISLRSNLGFISGWVLFAALYNCTALHCIALNCTTLRSTFVHSSPLYSTLFCSALVKYNNKLLYQWGITNDSFMTCIQRFLRLLNLIVFFIEVANSEFVLDFAARQITSYVETESLPRLKEFTVCFWMKRGFDGSVSGAIMSYVTTEELYSLLVVLGPVGGFNLRIMDSRYMLANAIYINFRILLRVSL